MRSGTDYFVVHLDEQESAVLVTGNHRIARMPREVGERLEQGIEHLRAEEHSAWEAFTLTPDADSNAETLRASSLADGADFAVNVNLTNICNLACTYCFAEGGDYGRMKEAMGEHSVAWIFRFIDENVAPGQRVRFEFFGGEPLANFALISKICERAERVADERGVTFVHRISTNLTLMPTGVIDLFRRHRFIVSVSLDGPREVQDRNRPSKNGSGSYDRIMRNLWTLRREAGDNVILVARMTIATETPTLLDSVRELWELNLFDFFQIYPGVYPVDQQGRSVALTLTLGDKVLSSPRQVTYVNHFLRPGMIEQFRDFLHAYPSFFTPDNRFAGVLEYERTAQMMIEGLTALSFCSGGRTYYTHSPDGTISPCHRLVGDEAFDVGTGEDGLTVPHPEWRRTVDEHPVCGQCWARYLCGGGCRQENFVASGDLNVLNEESCRYQLMLAEEMVRLVGRSGSDYRDRRREVFDDLFVSCGRPVVPNGRVSNALPDVATQPFTPIH
ncbi:MULTISPECIES: radical SAM/SPASM domain-containing protein [unclassified Micromonospora]|uniref:radical SAM/SPASM domain-containing protein n=1 Tax=unclassified Micromonospora TaxID=2617518 RepID=UPI001C5D7978|nr:radical SAM protein [Micromonospora sp. RL09-050-HVF-A]MBW4704659.1 SPASM domain-containing protein [Micromonospora sp. RL09-050-HVF-A]